MFIHPEDLYSAERMRIAELIRKRELERLVRLSHPREARGGSIGRYAVTLARRWWRAVSELIVGSQHAPPTINSGGWTRISPRLAYRAQPATDWDRTQPSALGRCPSRTSDVIQDFRPSPVPENLSQCKVANGSRRSTTR